MSAQSTSGQLFDNTSGNHAGSAPSGPQPGASTSNTSQRNPPGRSYQQSDFSEGGAFSLSRLFGANAGAGHFGGVGNDVAAQNREWLDRHEYDSNTEQLQKEDQARHDEEKRLQAMEDSYDPNVHNHPSHPPSSPVAAHEHASPAAQPASVPSQPTDDIPTSDAAQRGLADPSPAEPHRYPPSDPNRPRLHLPRVVDQSKAELNLSNIQNPKIRAYLDPLDDSLTPQDLHSWSQAELNELNAAIEPQHLTTIIRKAVEWYATDRCKPLSFRDVSLKNANGRFALRHVSGFLNPGQTVAILSAPDAGTTNLLNVLAGRQETGEIRGDVLYDGRPRDPSFQRHVGYVPKDDVNFALLTVKETLMFSAMTRTPYAPRHVIEFRVNLYMKLLGLAHAANTYIGDATIKGVSGGEKRRVSYGVEMVAGHGCILADLPTNGLDSASAYALIKTIRYINRSGGRSMMCSIVQPAPALFHLFDSVLLLSKGSVIYFGPTKSALQFVEAAGFVRPKNKSEPQFLEELTATPERFYETRVRKEGRAIEPPKLQHADHAQRSDGKIDTDAAMQIELQRQPSEEVKAAEEELKREVEMAPLQSRYQRAAENEEKQAAEQRPPESRDVALAVQEDPDAAMTKVKADEADLSAEQEEVKEYTLGEERVMATPQRMNAWKILTERYAASVFAERVIGVIERDQQRAQAEQRLMLTNQHHFPRNHNSDHRAAEPTKTGNDTSAADTQHSLDKAARNLQNFTGSMGVIEVTRGRAEMEQEERGPSGGQHRFNRSIAQQIRECIVRQMILTYRTPGLWFGSWVKACLMAIIAGTLFLNLPATTDYGRTRLGLFFFLCIYIGVGAVEILAFLMMSRGIYYEQRKAGYFRGLAYYIAVLTSQVPLALIETFLFAITVYGLAGLRSNDGSGYFWYFWLVILTVNLTSRCWVLTISTVCPNAVVAFVAIPISNVLFVQFAGFLEPRNDIPVAWVWMNYISFYDWAWRGLSTNELGDRSLVNTGDAPSITYGGSGAGNAVLQSYDINNNLHYKWFDLLWLTCFLGFFACLGALALLTVDWSRADTPQTPDFGDEAVARKKRAQQTQQQMSQAVQSKQGGHSAPAAAPTAGAQEAATDSGGKPAPQLQRYQSSMKSSRRVQSQHSAYESHQRDAHFQWRHLNYSVRLSNGTERMLLTDCFGYARPGLMIALMGASGAGKSTLLDVLAGKKTAGHMEGEVLLNGKPFDAASFNHTSAYAEQFDSHNAFSTVKEAIEFSALLRLPTAVASTPGEVDRRVAHVMQVLDLQHSANDIIGAPGFGGVSPEVRKKVTIAVELVMDPALLFLDEPTTGLDSAGAYAVMSSVKKLAQQMAVICTIHQPSNEIVHMFDWLLLLQPGGQVVFFGPVGELVPFFIETHIAEAPADKDSPDLNVADFALDAIRSAKAKLERGEQAVDMVEAFKKTQRYSQIQAELDKINAGDGGGGQSVDADGANQQRDVERGPPSPAAVSDNVSANVGNVKAANPDVAAAEADSNYAGFMIQLALLTERNVRNQWRNRLTIRTRYFTCIALGFVCGTLFFRLDYSQAAAQTRVSVLFVLTIIPMFLSSSSLAEVFAVRPLYFREHTSRMYGALPWFVARRIADIPFMVVEMTIFASMTYWIANMRHTNNGGYFFWALFTVFGIREAGSAFTQMVATAFASPEVASAFQSTAFTVFFLFAGFLIPEPLISNGWIWMYYLSFIRYPLDFLLGNELSSVTFDCSGYSNIEQCPVPVGDVLLNTFGVKYSLGERAINFVVLWIFWGGFLVLGFLALKFINHIKR